MALNILNRSKELVSTVAAGLNGKFNHALQAGKTATRAALFLAIPGVMACSEEGALDCYSPDKSLCYGTDGFGGNAGIAGQGNGGFTSPEGGVGGNGNGGYAGSIDGGMGGAGGYAGTEAGLGGQGGTAGKGGSAGTGGYGGTGGHGGVGGMGGLGGNGGSPDGGELQTPCTTAGDCTNPYMPYCIPDPNQLQKFCAHCTEGISDCDGTCIDTNSDSNNCGGCKNTCKQSEFCFGGKCITK